MVSQYRERVNAVDERIKQLEGQLIVSCQAAPEDAFYGPENMARFARSAERGGAGGIRASGAADVAAIKAAVDVPVIGIWKALWTDGQILITPEFEQARALVEAGATVIALDCTARGRRSGALDRVRRIRAELGVPVMADVATIEEAEIAMEHGASLVAPTMRGYTEDTRHITRFDVALLREMVRRIPVPVVAEGRIATPEDARAARQAGAWAVVVGTAITRPHEVAAGFAAAVRAAGAVRSAHYLGIDMGGTNTKYGVVAGDGSMLFHSSVPTPAGAGRTGLLEHLKRVAQVGLEQSPVPVAAVGIATAGWVNRDTGTVAYATDNLPGWTGAPIAGEIGAVVNLPVGVENDANALAVAEYRFGLAQGLPDFVCITLGTGVGGGCYVNGRLNHGKHWFANALGHITIESAGLPCTCGRKGCLEVYANSSALVRYAGGGAVSAEAVIARANGGDEKARAAVRQLGEYLALGLASIIHMFDPEMVILSGGLVQDNALLMDHLRQRLAGEVNAFAQRSLVVEASQLGYFGGVVGAAAVAEQRLLAVG